MLLWSRLDKKATLITSPYPFFVYQKKKTVLSTCAIYCNPKGKQKGAKVNTFSDIKVSGWTLITVNNESYLIIIGFRFFTKLKHLVEHLQ